MQMRAWVRVCVCVNVPGKVVVVSDGERFASRRIAIDFLPRVTKENVDVVVGVGGCWDTAVKNEMDACGRAPLPAFP